MWNWTRRKSVPLKEVVPLTTTSMVVPRFSNSTACSGMSTTGRSAAAPIVASEDVSLTQALLWIMTFRLVRLLGESSVPMLMGDWFAPALHASFSGAREAQLNGPSKGPYPNVLTSTVPLSLPAALLNIESPWRHVAEAVEAKMRDLKSILKRPYAMMLEAGKERIRCETMLLLRIFQNPGSPGILCSRRKDPQQRSSGGEQVLTINVHK